MNQERFICLRESFLNGTAKEKWKAENSLYKELAILGKILLKKKNLEVDIDTQEEVLNTSIFKVFKNLQNYNPEYMISTWFGTILKNELMDRWRMEEKRGNGKKDSIERYYKGDSDDNNSLDIADDFSCPAYDMDKNTMIKVLYRTMSALNDSQRRILDLHIQGKSNSEIMDITGWNKNYVGTNLFRAINILKEIHSSPNC
ncbi:MAG: RNA polymerase sigma factor [Bacteroidota bacterium]|jgi:RNA polymerase sigma factor (sigma-70 family)